MVGAIGLEPTTPTMSRWCSNQLSYAPASGGFYLFQHGGSNKSQLGLVIKPARVAADSKAEYISDGRDRVRLAAGSFSMGGDDGPPDEEQEFPLRTTRAC